MRKGHRFVKRLTCQRLCGVAGPVLSVIRVDTADEALEVENNNPHGNAACIYTQSGASGEYFSSRFRTPPDLVGGPDLKILVVLGVG